MQQQHDLHLHCKITALDMRTSYDMVELLLNSGVPVDSLGEVGFTPLLRAIFSNRDEIAKLLLVNGANPNALMTDGRPVLEQAVKKGNLNMVNHVLEHGANVAHVGTGGFTILHAVKAFRFSEEILDSLISAGADISARDAANNTPLHIAALGGEIELVELFLQKNACIDATNDDGLTARDLAESMVKKHQEATKDMAEDRIDEYFEDHQVYGWYFGDWHPPQRCEIWNDVLDEIDDEKQRREDVRLEEIRQNTCIAVMMGHHHRLGASSRFNMIDSDVTRLVLQLM